MFSVKVFAVSLVFVIIICPNGMGANGDFNVNCKTKVRNMWLKYCVNNGVRLKRDVFQLDSEDHRDSGTTLRAFNIKRQIFPQPTAASSLIAEILLKNNREYRGREIVRPRDQGYSESTRGPDTIYPGYSGFGFPPPISGDDLGMGLSYNDLEELYEEIIERLPRAAKNKDETFRMITEYAARCCNENLGNNACSDPASVINCP